MPADFVLTDHARLRLARRGIDPAIVQDVMERQRAQYFGKTSRVVVQDLVQSGKAEYLLRVVVDADRKPAEVVTAYITSKIKKYGGRA